MKKTANLNVSERIKLVSRVLASVCESLCNQAGGSCASCPLSYPACCHSSDFQRLAALVAEGGAE